VNHFYEVFLFHLKRIREHFFSFEKESLVSMSSTLALEGGVDSSVDTCIIDSNSDHHPFMENSIFFVFVPFHLGE
jgi:hypothetical protein